MRERAERELRERAERELRERAERELNESKLPSGVTRQEFTKT